MVSITKGASIVDKFRRTSVPHGSARQAFSTFLNAIGVTSGDQILLPSFIGWSAREGSGVFDPVADAQLEPLFYRLDDRLRIDLDHLQQQIISNNPKALVLIHYFGYVDPSTDAVIELAREHGIPVLEDEAHAMLTDLVGGGSGRQGDAVIFSLHKMLPLESGGLLVWNSANDSLDRASIDEEASTFAREVESYDLWAIAQARRRNAARIHELLGPLSDHVEPLWGMPADTEVPQTYPVLIKSRSRDDLYQEMNERRFGVVSLYHTLISQITPEEFPESHAVAKKIMNLPVHQDVEAPQIDAMVDALAELVR